MTDDKNNTSGAAAADGIDDNDASVITKDVAYTYAARELLAANRIGDTEGSAKVENANAQADGIFKITLGQAKVANALSFNLHCGSRCRHDQ